MKQLFYIGLLLILVTSCRCPKVMTDTKVITDTLTVEKKIIERDTIFFTDTARVAVKIPVFQLNDISKPFKPIIKQHKNARVIIKRIRDTIRFTAECDSIELAAKIKDQFIKEHHKKETLKTEIVQIRYIPKWVKWLAWLGAICILAIGVKVASRFYGFKIPF